MSFNFFKNYLKTKGESVESGTISLIAKYDADGLSETAIKQKKDEHDEACRQLAEARSDFEREKKEFLEVDALFKRKMSAAERAQADLDQDSTNQDAATALAELTADLETLAPKLDKERNDYERAQQYLDSLQEASNEIAKELLTLCDQVNDAKAAQKEAAVELKREEKRKAQAEVLAGLKSSSNKFDVAMDALKKQTEAKQREVEAARISADQLTKPVTKTSAATNKYLDETSGVNNTESLSDRLARLKTKI